MSLPPSPRRILIVRLSHLGDVVHTLPVFHALRRAFPGARLAWAVQSEFAELLAPLPSLARVIRFDRHGGLRAWVRLARQLNQFRPDWTVDAQGNLKSAAVTMLSRARHRTGFDRSDVRESGASLVLTDRAPRWDSGGASHAIDRSLHLAAHVTGESVAEVRDALPEDWMGLSAVELSTGRKRWRERMAEGVGQAVILQLADTDDVRSWPLSHQLQLLRELSTRGRRVLVLSGPREAQLGERVAQALAGLPHLVHWIGQNSLRELAATLSAAREAGAVMLSCDSGPLHLAAATGLKTIALAGPQDESRTGPWPIMGAGSPHQSLRAPGALHCAPCLSRTCGRGDGPVCMQRIEPAQVLRALELALR